MTVEQFYKSKEWDNLRLQLMQERTNEQGVLYCEYCGQPINKKYDCIGHHKLELTQDNVNDVTVSLNKDNIQLIHFRCHNLIHKRFEGFSQEVFLVYGAPCSGKTTWVYNVANDDDLILDIDKLWEAVCKCDREHKPNRLKANVFGLRDCMLEQIKTRTGKWRNAYVIGTYPLKTERERLCSLLNAETVFIDETRDTCMARATTQEWKQYVADWFDNYTG